jgi:hypothetical protein
MRAVAKGIPLFSLCLLILCLAPLRGAGDELIPPSRTLQEPGSTWGGLTVFSEPPQLEVYLDGKKVGETPVWLKHVKAGFHRLRVEHSETDIYLEPGGSIELSLYKGSFINLAREKRKGEKETGVEAERPTEHGKAAEAPKEPRDTDLTPWEKFINRTLRHF